MEKWQKKRKERQQEKKKDSSQEEDNSDEESECPFTEERTDFPSDEEDGPELVEDLDWDVEQSPDGSYLISKEE